MRKIIAAINMTLDGICDHTAVSPDEEIHDYYTALMERVGCLLYGRTTYQLMEFWRSFLETPSGEPHMDNFAQAIHKVPKLDFSHTLKSTDWESASIATESLQHEAERLKKEGGKDIFAGSPGIIVQLANLQLIDSFEICIHPVVAGKGLPLFQGIEKPLSLNLTHTRKFGCGAVIHTYEVIK